MKSKRLADIVAPLLVYSASVVAFFPRLLLGDVIYCRETFRLNFPIKAYADTRLAQGELPLWFPYDGLGVPFVGSTVTGFFHPTTLLHFVTDAAGVLTINELLLTALAFFGTWWLARRLGARPAAAAVAAVAFAFSGPVFSTSTNLPFFYGATAFPLFLVGVDVLAVGERRRVGVVLAALGLASAVLGGDLEAGYVFGLVGLLYVLGRVETGRLHAVLRLAAAGALGLGLSAVQLLPSLALFRQVDRAHGLDWPQASMWSVHPLRLPEIFLGDIVRFTPVEPDVQARFLLGPPQMHLWHLTVFVGVVVFAGLVLAIRGRADRPRITWVLVGLGAALLLAALGRYGGLYRAMYAALPFWDGFRFPAKLLPFAMLPLALLGGLGVNWGLSHPKPARNLVLVLAGVVALVAATAWLWPQPWRSVAGALGTPGPQLAREAVLWTDGLLRVSLRAAVLLAAFALLLHLSQSPRPALRLASGPFVAALALLDVTAVNGRAVDLCTGPAETLQLPSRFAADLGAQRPGRYRVTAGANAALNMRLPGIVPENDQSYLGLSLWTRQALGPDLGALDGIEGTTAYLPAITDRLEELASDGGDSFSWWARAWWGKWSRLFNGKYLVLSTSTWRKMHGHPDLVVSELPRYDLSLVRVPGALPRVYLAAADFVSDRAAARRALGAKPVLDGAEAVVEAPAPQGWTASGPVDGTVHLEAYAPERIETSVETDRPSVLVVNDAYFEGWKATVDGAPAEVLRTNYVVRGVLVDAGRHDVVLSYPVPPAILIGAAVSLASLIAAAVLGLWRRRRHVA